MKKSLQKDFTHGSIPRQLLALTLPFMLSNALQLLYATVDMVIVGAFVGTAGLCAVSQSSMVINFGVMSCLGFSNSGQILVAQALGGGKKQQIQKIVGTLFSVVGLLGLGLSVIYLCFGATFLSWVNIPPESRDMAREYLMISAGGLVFTAGYNMVSSVLRGMGDSLRPLLFIGIASGVNLVLDLIFTGWWGWGVAGAAWATIIGQAVSFLFSLFYLYRRKEAFGFDFRPKSFRIHKSYAKMIASLGAPMAVQSGAINVSMLFVISLVNSVGVVAGATFGVGVKIDDIINKLSQGIQYAAVPIISQNIGGGKPRRAKATVFWACLYALVLTALFMTAYLVWGKQLFMLFSSDPAVLAMSGTFIAAILWMFPAFVIMRGTGSFIQGIGNARLGMILAMLDGVVLRIGLSWLFGSVFGWGFYGFVLGYGLAPYGMAIPGLIYFLAGRWERAKTLAQKME